MKDHPYTVKLKKDKPLKDHPYSKLVTVTFLKRQTIGNIKKKIQTVKVKKIPLNPYNLKCRMCIQFLNVPPSLLFSMYRVGLVKFILIFNVQPSNKVRIRPRGTKSSNPDRDPGKMTESGTAALISKMFSS